MEIGINTSASNSWQSYSRQNSYSIAGMHIFAFSYLTGWVDMCFSSYFTALERPVRSLLTSLLGTLVFPIVSLALLTPIWQLDGVWLTSIVSGAASALFTIMVAATVKVQIKFR